MHVYVIVYTPEVYVAKTNVIRKLFSTYRRILNDFPLIGEQLFNIYLHLTLRHFHHSGVPLIYSDR